MTRYGDSTQGRQKVKVETVGQIQELVRSRRLELGETQAAAASRAGVSRKWLSDFERGATLAVELPQLLRILTSLALTLDVVPASPGTATEGNAEESGQDLDRLLNRYLGISSDRG